MDYATLTQIRDYLKLSAAETADDTLLQRFINDAADYINDIRRCDVRYETRYYDYPIQAASAFGVYDAETWVAQMNAAGLLSQGRLALDDDLLALDSVVNGNVVVIPLTELVTEPANLYPKHILRLKRGSDYRWLPGTNGEREQVIAVAGLWGYRQGYATAWVNSLDTVRDLGGISATAATITVSDADAAAADLESPRFQAGQLLKLADEFVTVLAVNTTTNVLTVARAANGTTAAVHAQGVAVFIFRPAGKIQLAATRLVVWRYRQKDVNTFDKSTSFETGITIVPATIPNDIRSLLPPPRRVSL